MLWSISLGNVLVKQIEWISLLQDFSELAHAYHETPSEDYSVVFYYSIYIYVIYVSNIYIYTHI